MIKRYGHNFSKTFQAIFAQKDLTDPPLKNFTATYSKKALVKIISLRYMLCKVVQSVERKFYQLQFVDNVRTVRRKLMLTFILFFGSNRNAFYLHIATSAVCSSTLCYVHAGLSKGSGYCMDLSVPSHTYDC